MFKKESVLLLVGDILVFVVSLWLVLFFRYVEIPSQEILILHLKPFLLLFFVWAVVFFVSGLYEKRILIIKRSLFAGIFYAQLINSAVASVFFYFASGFGITPKTNLFLYLIISFVLIISWRAYVAPLFGVKRTANAILLGDNEEIMEIGEAIKHNRWYNLNLVEHLSLNNISGEDNFRMDLQKIIDEKSVSVIIADLANENIKPFLPFLYNLMFSGVKFMNAYDVYEDIFGRIPLTLVRYDWFLKNVSVTSHFAYDFFKRLVDIIVAFGLILISLILYPFVCLAIKAEDGGSIFVVQERVGKGGKKIKIIKFRSMTASGSEVTKIGKFLRKSSIDELPQLFLVLKGDLSLIGPRPELPALVDIYSKEISYYNIRHILKPGLSGWAQIYQKEAPRYRADIDKTKIKLSYDLFYVKYHSFVLDLKIALKTIKLLLSRHSY